MATWDPMDITNFDRDDIEDAYSDWDNDFKSNIEITFNRLRKFNETLNECTDEDTIEMIEKDKDKFNPIQARLFLPFKGPRGGL